MSKKNASAEKTVTARITSNTVRDVAELQEKLRLRSTGSAPELTGAIRAAMDRAGFVPTERGGIATAPPVSQVLEIASGLLRATLEEQDSAASARVKPLDKLSGTLRALVRHQIPGFTPVLIEADTSNVGQFLDEISSDRCYAAISSSEQIEDRPPSCSTFAALVSIDGLPSLAAHPEVHFITPMIGDTQSPEVIDELSKRGLTDADLRAIPSLEHAGLLFQFFNEEALESLIFTVISVKKAQHAAAQAIEPKKKESPSDPQVGKSERATQEPGTMPIAPLLPHAPRAPADRWFPSGTVMYGAPPFGGWRGALEATMSGPKLISSSSGALPKVDPTEK